MKNMYANRGKSHWFVMFVTSLRLGPLVFFVARLPGFGKAANPTVAESFQWRGVSWRDSGGPIGMFRGLAYPDMLEKGGPKNSDVQSLKVSVSPKVLLEGIDFDVGAKNRNTLRYVEMKVCNFNCGRNGLKTIIYGTGSVGSI